MDTMMTIEELHKSHFRSLETGRLPLRPLTLLDDEDMFAYTSIPDSFCYLRENAHTDISQTQKFLENAVNGYREHREFIWGISEKESGRLIGTCRLFDVATGDSGGEVSYMLHPAYQGNGYASEAISAVMTYAFEELGLLRIQARCVIRNTASARVMEHCGMQKEGVLRGFARIHGIQEDYLIYAAINRSEGVKQ